MYFICKYFFVDLCCINSKKQFTLFIYLSSFSFCFILFSVLSSLFSRSIFATLFSKRHFVLFGYSLVSFFVIYLEIFINFLVFFLVIFILFLFFCNFVFLWIREFSRDVRGILCVVWGILGFEKTTNVARGERRRMDEKEELH